MTDFDLYINNSTTDEPLDTSGVAWEEVDQANDYFLFSNGGAGVTDDEDIPTDEEKNRAAVQLSLTSAVVVPKYFLADYSADKLKEIKNAGNQQKQYVFGCSFDGATASEPQLEAWDNENMNTYVGTELGAGTPSNSWYKAICTTVNPPGADWTGISLAGNGASNVVFLNGGSGALTTAKDLYFNFKIIIPGGYVIPAVHVPVLVITWTTN